MDLHLVIMYVSILSYESGCNDGFFLNLVFFSEVGWGVGGWVGIMLCLSSSGFSCCFLCFLLSSLFRSYFYCWCQCYMRFKHSIVASIKHIHVNTLSNKHLIQHNIYLISKSMHCKECFGHLCKAFHTCIYKTERNKN